MRVQIDHEEVQKGLIIKKTFNAVRCSVTFSQEELHKIKADKLGDYVLVERPPSAGMKTYPTDDPRRFFLYVKNLVKGSDTFVAENSIDAKEYEELLVNSLRNLKEAISSEITEKSKTIEI